MTFAAMDQFKQLWADDMKGGLPVIINIMDNQYGMGGQTRGETMGFDFAARHRRRRQPGPDARRTRGRLQPAGRDRLLPP